MNEQDLRDCFAMFAMLGLIMADQGTISKGTATDSYELADLMLAARSKKEEPQGIVAIKKKLRSRT